MYSNPRVQAKTNEPKKPDPYTGKQFVRVTDWLSYARVHKQPKALFEWTIENDPEITEMVSKDQEKLPACVGVDTVTLIAMALARADELWALYCQNVTIVVQPTLTNDLAKEVTRRFTELTNGLRFNLAPLIRDDNGKLVCGYLSQHANFSNPIPSNMLYWH